jgi:peroxiredoxin
MEPILAINMILLWAAFLLLLSMMLTVVRRLRSISQMLAYQMSAGSIPKLTVGEPAPDFIAFNHFGQPVTLSNYIGHNFTFIFISPFCEPCRNEVPELVKIFPMAKLSGVDMVLVTMTTATDMEPLIKEYNVPLPVLYSPPQISSLTDTYDPDRVYPFYCFVNEQGIVTSTDVIGEGDWPNLLHQWELASKAKDVI